MKIINDIIKLIRGISLRRKCDYIARVKYVNKQGFTYEPMLGNDYTPRLDVPLKTLYKDDNHYEIELSRLYLPCKVRSIK